MITVSGVPVEHLTLTLGLWGDWLAMVRLVGADVPIGAVTLALPDGLRLSGHVIRARQVRGAAQAILGGAPGLAMGTVSAGNYVDVPARVPITDVLTQAGQSLSELSDTELLDRRLHHWVRRGGDLPFVALGPLMAALGACWRVDPTGAIEVQAKGTSLGEATSQVEVIERRLTPTRVDQATITPPTLVPGQTLQGEVVQRVIYIGEPSGLHAEVHYA